MNKTDLKKMALGVIIGTVGILLLTLTLWGDEWYKVIISITAGVIVGMFIADYQLAMQIFRDSLIRSFREKFIAAFKSDLVTWACIFVFFVLLFVPIIMIVVMMLTPKGTNPIVLISYCLPLLWIIRGHNSLDYKDWKNKLSADQIRRLWSEAGDLRYKYEHGVYGDDYMVVDLDHYRKTLNEKKIAKAIIYSSFFAFSSSFFGVRLIPKTIAKFVKNIVRSIVTVVVFLGTLVFTLPFWIIKEISKSGKMISVCGSIVTGGIVGTYSHSYYYGIGVSIFILISSQLLTKIEKVNLIYFCEKGRLLDRMWS